MSPDECKFTNGERQGDSITRDKASRKGCHGSLLCYRYLLSWWCARVLRVCINKSSCGSWTGSTGRMDFTAGREYPQLWLNFSSSDVPVESLRLRFALLQSLNTTLETFFLPLVELRQTEMYSNSIAALLQEAKGQLLREHKCSLKGIVFPLALKTSGF